MFANLSGSSGFVEYWILKKYWIKKKPFVLFLTVLLGLFIFSLFTFLFSELLYILRQDFLLMFLFYLQLKLKLNVQRHTSSIKGRSVWRYCEAELFLIPNIVFFLSGSYINILLLLSKPSEWLLLKYELSST